MAGKKNPNLGDKLRQEREGAENTLRDSRSKTADSSTGDGGKKKAEHRRQIRHEADLAKMRSKKLKSEQEVKAKKNAAASGKKGGKPKKPGNLAADALSAKAHQSVRNADQDNNSGVEAAHFTEGSAEGAARAGSRFQYGRKLRQYKKLERLEKKANKDAVDSIFAERMKSDPQAGSNLFSRWRQKQAIVDITNQSTIQQGLCLRPEFVTGLAVPFGVGNEGCGQLQNILFAVNIREGIIMHRLSEIDSIENPDTVSVLQKGLAAVDYDIAFRVSDHIGTVAL